MASITNSTLAFGGASASDYLRSSSNGVGGIPLKSLGRAFFTTTRRRDLAMTTQLKKVVWCGEELLKKRDVVVATSRELEGEVEKLSSNETSSEDEPSSEVLNKMIEKLKFEIDDEYTEAVKEVGLEERLTALREEFSKASTEEHPVLIEKIEKLKEEFNTRLTNAPNYDSLNFKLNMMKDFSRAKAASKATSLKREINKRFHPEIIEKFEAIRAEVASSGASSFDELTDELKEKLLKTKAEVEAEMVSVVKSMGLEVEDVKPNLKDVVAKTFVPNENLQERLEKLNQEITEKIEEVVKSPEIKSMVELLKVETAKARQMQGVTEASQKIEMLEQKIKQKIAEALSMSGLQEKQEELENKIAATWFRNRETADGQS